MCALLLILAHFDKILSIFVLISSLSHVYVGTVLSVFLYFRLWSDQEAQWYVLPFCTENRNILQVVSSWSIGAIITIEKFGYNQVSVWFDTFEPALCYMGCRPTDDLSIPELVISVIICPVLPAWFFLAGPVWGHDIIVRYNDALSLLGGKTACV